MSTDMGFEPTEISPYYFISYSTEDKDRVAEYLLRMNADGFPLWYDKGIPPGANFDRVISEHIRECEAVILFMSKVPFKKEDSFVRTEFNIAKRRKKEVHVIYLDEIADNEVPAEYDLWWDQLGRIQGFFATRIGFEDAIKQIYNAVGFDPKTGGGGGPVKKPGNDKGGWEPPKPIIEIYPLDVSPISPSGYKYYLGGLTFSDDPAILGKPPVNGVRTKRLIEALKEIFYHWQTDVVFADADGSELKEDFLNLMRAYSSRSGAIDGGRLQEILSHNVDVDPTRNRNGKFFRLFYEIIFQGRERPREFYWSNNISRARLTPLFKDVNDFSDKFCEESAVGENVRKIYHTHTKEICSFLEISKPDQLIDSIMISTVKRRGEVIWLDDSGGSLVNLGSVNEFIKKMSVFSELQSMRSMVNFLRDFGFEPVSEGSDRYVLFSRDNKSFLTEIYENSIKNDPELFDLLNITEDGREMLANYLTLLKEYINITSAKQISIPTKRGVMTFGVAGFTADVKRVTKEYCELKFGDGVSEAVKNSEFPQKLGFLKIAQLLDKYGIIKATDGSELVNRCLDIVSGNKGADAYIQLFADEKPTIVWRNQQVTVEEYIERKVESLEDGAVLSFFNSTPIVEAYISGNKTLAARMAKEFKALDDEYSKYYEEFVDIIGGLRELAPKKGGDAPAEQEVPQAAPEAPAQSDEPAVSENNTEPMENTETKLAEKSEDQGKENNSSEPIAKKPEPATPVTSTPDPPKTAPAASPEPEERPGRRARQPRGKGGQSVEKAGEQLLSDLLNNLINDN